MNKTLTVTNVNYDFTVSTDGTCLYSNATPVPYLLTPVHTQQMYDFVREHMPWVDNTLDADSSYFERASHILGKEVARFFIRQEDPDTFVKPTNFNSAFEIIEHLKENSEIVTPLESLNKSSWRDNPTPEIVEFLRQRVTIERALSPYLSRVFPAGGLFVDETLCNNMGDAVHAPNAKVFFKKVFKTYDKKAVERFEKEFDYGFAEIPFFLPILHVSKELDYQFSIDEISGFLRKPFLDDEALVRAVKKYPTLTAKKAISWVCNGDDEISLNDTFNALSDLVDNNLPLISLDSSQGAIHDLANRIFLTHFREHMNIEDETVSTMFADDGKDYVIERKEELVVLGDALKICCGSKGYTEKLEKNTGVFIFRRDDTMIGYLTEFNRDGKLIQSRGYKDANSPSKIKEAHANIFAHMTLPEVESDSNINYSELLENGARYVLLEYLEG